MFCLFIIYTTRINMYSPLYSNTRNSACVVRTQPKNCEHTNSVIKPHSNPWIMNQSLYGQDFKKLQAIHANARTLFEDPEFPPIGTSLYFSKTPSPKIRWTRASTLVENSKFFHDGVSRFDIKQGKIGNCWFLAAIADLTMDKELFYKVVPQDQSFMKDYAGIFHFRFWQYGEWIDVVVDDYLPTRKGRLVFLHSQSKNEFWPALLEKAYAKLHGSYEALKGGVAGDALVDFTGGCSEMYGLKNDMINMDLRKLLKKALRKRSFAACSIDADQHSKVGETDKTGLIRMHAYSITKILTLQDTSKTLLIRIRNPWGDTEWNGAWSDGSTEWNSISNDEKESMGLVFDNDGEFWMSYDDFQKYWDTLEICNLSPNFQDNGTVQNFTSNWHVKSFTGSWILGKSAGGSPNFTQTFVNNPQFQFILEDPDPDDDEDKCTVVISLMQKGRRELRDEGFSLLNIGVKIYHLQNPGSLSKPLKEKFFCKNKAIKGTNLFTDRREVTHRLCLYPGAYCIIPCTFEPETEGDFFLRIFTECQIVTNL